MEHLVQLFVHEDFMYFGDVEMVMAILFSVPGIELVEHHELHEDGQSYDVYSMFAPGLAMEIMPVELSDWGCFWLDVDPD